MKIVIFAGGVGSRLWPLSRKNSPKQFEKIIGDKSILQQTVDRLMPQFHPQDIYIATGIRYQEILKEQLPLIPSENFIFEPEMRDVGPAIGLIASILDKKFPHEPIAILWSDHLVKNNAAFQEALLLAKDTIQNKKSKFVFIAQHPRFANQNIGWIQIGEEVEARKSIKIYAFKRMQYKPSLEEAEQFLASKDYFWNLGYFVTTPAYLVSLYKEFVPKIFAKLQEISDAYETPDFEDRLTKIYPTLEKISFDDAILVKMRHEDILVISAELGWSDVGAWEALKEALAESEDENVVNGEVLLEGARDNLVYNYNNQLVVGIDLEHMLVINTGDVLLVCPKTSVPKIKTIVEELVGTPHEHLI